MKIDFVYCHASPLVESISGKAMAEMNMSDEYDMIRRSLERSRSSQDVYTKCFIAKMSNLEQLMDCNPSVVHISAHSDTNSAIHVENESGTSSYSLGCDDLLRIFSHKQNKAKLVVISSCYSAKIANSLVCGAAEHAIGVKVNRRVSEECCNAFSSQLYELLFSTGSTMQQAFEAAARTCAPHFAKDSDASCPFVLFSESNRSPNQPFLTTLSKAPEVSFHPLFQWPSAAMAASLSVISPTAQLPAPAPAPAALNPHGLPSFIAAPPNSLSCFTTTTVKKRQHMHEKPSEQHERKQEQLAVARKPVSYTRVVDVTDRHASVQRHSGGLVGREQVLKEVMDSLWSGPGSSNHNSNRRSARGPDGLLPSNFDEEIEIERHILRTTSCYDLGSADDEDEDDASNGKACRKLSIGLPVTPAPRRDPLSALVTVTGERGVGTTAVLERAIELMRVREGYFGANRVVKIDSFGTKCMHHYEELLSEVGSEGANVIDVLEMSILAVFVEYLRPFGFSDKGNGEWATTMRSVIAFLERKGADDRWLIALDGCDNLLEHCHDILSAEDSRSQRINRLVSLCPEDDEIDVFGSLRIEIAAAEEEATLYKKAQFAREMSWDSLDGDSDEAPPPPPPAEPAPEAYLSTPRNPLLTFIDAILSNCSSNGKPYCHFLLTTTPTAPLVGKFEWISTRNVEEKIVFISPLDTAHMAQVVARRFHANNTVAAPGYSELLNALNSLMLVTQQPSESFAGYAQLVQILRGLPAAAVRFQLYAAVVNGGNLERLCTLAAQSHSETCCSRPNVADLQNRWQCNRIGSCSSDYSDCLLDSPLCRQRTRTLSSMDCWVDVSNGANSPVSPRLTRVSGGIDGSNDGTLAIDTDSVHTSGDRKRIARSFSPFPSDVDSVQKVQLKTSIPDTTTGAVKGNAASNQFTSPLTVAVLNDSPRSSVDCSSQQEKQSQWRTVESMENA